MTRLYRCLYLDKGYVPNSYSTGGHFEYRKLFCWFRPPRRRTQALCQNCLLAAKINGWDEPRTPRMFKFPNWAKEAAT